MLAVKIDTKGLKGSLIVVCYSQSANVTSFLDYFENCCETNIDHSDVNIICGDFNINLLKKTNYSDKVLKIINNQGMKQFLKTPTRVTKTSKSLIDYVISNDYNIRVNVMLDQKINDHSSISFSVSKN